MFSTNIANRLSKNATTLFHRVSKPLHLVLMQSVLAVIEQLD
jgi:hypothetical protein